MLPLYNPLNNPFGECLCSAQLGCRPLLAHPDKLPKEQEHRPENRRNNLGLTKTFNRQKPLNCIILNFEKTFVIINETTLKKISSPDAGPTSNFGEADRGIPG